MHLSSWAGWAILAAVCAASACGGSKSSSSGFDGSDGGSSSGGSSGGDGSVGTFGNGDGGEGGAGCAVHCSADLHQVLDCNNHVVTTCPSTEGCGAGGQCVPACESATANKSTIGCDYYSVDPGTDGEANGSCFAAYIANTWTSPVAITVEYAGKSMDAAPYAYVPTGQGTSITYAPLSKTGNKLPPGQLAIVFLADATAVTGVPLPTPCPAGVTTLYKTAEASSENTGIINAFHLTTSAPVVAYDIFPYGGSKSYISSATLLLPSSAWGTNYLPIDSFPKSGAASSEAQPFIEITASQAATHVTILPTVAIVGGTGVAAAPAGKPVTYTLAQGQVLQLKQDAELNGSPIQSDKPIGVWGGASCFNIGLSDCCCDSAHQQLPPVKALGNEYVAVRYRNRVAGQEEDPPWRLMGAVKGTTLTYEPATPTGAPTTLGVGQVAMFYSGSPFVVKSQDAQHPFYMSGHMTGQEFMGGNYQTGDPEFVNVIPPAEWLTSYVFMTDPTIGNTNLIIVREKGKTGFADVTLDCLGKLPTWLPIGATSYEYASVDLVIGGAEQGKCGNGRHEITSTEPFGLTVWGWDTTVSYAYPSGASVQPINTVVVPPMGSQ